MKLTSRGAVAENHIGSYASRRSRQALGRGTLPIRLLAVIALVLTGILPVAEYHPLASGAAGEPTFLFVDQNSDVSGSNVVQSYGLYNNGRITDQLISSYPTGHPGATSSFVASPRADLAYDMAHTAAHLYALNLGDSTVSIFSINPFSGQLTLEGTTASLGQQAGFTQGITALAVNPAGTVLYGAGAENENSPDELLAYHINSDGTINITPFSMVDVAVDGLAVSPDGSEVAAAFPTGAKGGALPTTAAVMLFKLDSAGGFSGSSAVPVQLAEPCATYVKFATSSSLYSASCAPGALTSYAIGSGTPTQADSTPISSQVLAAGPAGDIYVQTSSGLQRVQVGNGGTFTRPFGPAAAYPYNTITSMAVAPDDSQLFVAADTNSTTNYVDDYAIQPDGSLVHAVQIPLPAGIPTVLTFTAQCPGVNSSCVETQNFTITVDPGTITVSTPYTAQDPFVLPPMKLSSDGSYLSSSAAFPSSALPGAQQIVVTSTLAPAYAWSLSVSATNLSDGTGGVIPSSGLGLTGGVLLNPGPGAGTYPGAVSFTDIAPHNPSPQDTDNNTGLTSSPQTWARSTAADGTAEMDGTLTLLAPTSTPAGVYTGTVTVSVS